MQEYIKKTKNGTHAFSLFSGMPVMPLLHFHQLFK